jgi:AraC-like DNA-binding protein
MLQPHAVLDGLSLFKASPALHQHDRHAHDCLSVIMLVQGRKSYSIEKRRVNVHAGQIAIANPGEVHGCEYIGEESWAHSTWYLSYGLLAQLSAEAGLAHVGEIVSPVVDSPLLHARLVAAHAAAQHGNELEREAAALEGMLLLLGEYGRERIALLRHDALPQVRKRVAVCQEVIHASSLHRLNLTALAQESGVNRHQVIRDFQQVLQLTPGQYLRSVRLTRTKALIAEGMPLADVAYLAGFSDQSHFSRVFKSVHGFTPNEFALAARNRKWMQMI